MSEKLHATTNKPTIMEFFFILPSLPCNFYEQLFFICFSGKGLFRKGGETAFQKMWNASARRPPVMRNTGNPLRLYFSKKTSR